MIKKILIASTILLGSCGPAPQAVELKAYITHFESRFGLDASSIDVLYTFEPFSPKDLFLGMCHYKEDYGIRINAYAWPGLSEERRHNLIAHEMGHCLLGRDHVHAWYPDGCPTSIMAASLIADGCIAKHPEIEAEFKATP